MNRAKVFKETYHNYLDQLATIDLASKAKILGASVDGDGLVLPFYTHNLRISSTEVIDVGGRTLSHSIRVVACRYVILCPEEIPSDKRLATFREFKDSAPLTSHFVTNTNKTIETEFAGKSSLLRDRCRLSGGKEIQSTTHDLSVLFYALPQIPVYLNFNDRDEEFPASCSILYQRNAESYLDMECLSITGTYLTGMLITA